MPTVKTATYYVQEGITEIKKNTTLPDSVIKEPKSDAGQWK
jgi:hypothetical protein